MAQSWLSPDSSAKNPLISMRNSKTKWGQTTLKPLMALGGCPRILLKKLSSFNKKLGKNMDRPP